MLKASVVKRLAILCLVLLSSSVATRADFLVNTTVDNDQGVSDVAMNRDGSSVIV